MRDERKVVAIAFCSCCGARPRLSRVMGVYTPGTGWYCIPCEYAIKNAPSTPLTAEATAFVRRLSQRVPNA